jgi:hypothetical protein
MPRQIAKKANPEIEVPGPQYLEVPLVVYSSGKRVRVGITSVFRDGIVAHFDKDPDDSFARALIDSITRGDVNALSIAPTPEKVPSLADYYDKEKEQP